MKKKFISVLLSAVMAVSMIGCGSSSGAKDSEKKEEAKTVEAKADIPSEIKNKVEIEFWHSMKGGNEESIKQITKDFEDKNPNIKIKLVNQGGYRDLFQKLMGAAKSNTLPAITQIYNNRLTWYMDKELVQDLKPYEKDKKHGMKDEEVKDIAEIFYKDGTFGDKQYSLPLNKSQMVMYYNEDMLKEKGVEVPKTWDELKEASKKLTVDKDKDGKPEVHGIAFENNISTDIGIWVRQAGGEVIDEDKDKINFDSAETKVAVNFISEMIKDKTATLAGEDKHSNNVFIKKRASMCVASTSALPYIKKSFESKWFVAPLPVDKVYAQLYYGTNIAMFNKGTPEQKLAAWLYMKHLINTENTTKFSMDTGYIPVRKSAIESEKYKEFLKKNQAKEVPLKTLDKGWTGSRGIGTIPALDVLGKELEQVFAGKKSVDEALKTAQQNGEKAMKEARSN